MGWIRRAINKLVNPPYDLILRAQAGDLAKVQAALDAGADIEERRNNATAIIFAAERGHFDVVKLLLERGANVNPAALWDWDSLTQAVIGGNIDIVKLFIQQGADLNTCDPEHEYTPLMYAVRDGQIEIARVLLESGADVNAVDTGGMTALDYAEEETKNSAVIEVLLEFGGKSSSGDV